jgi:hypothetical protein
MRFYPKQHPLYCGIDLHARRMYVCIVSHNGEVLVHRNMKAAPEPFLKAITPYCDHLVVAVAGIFPWYWLAALCAREGMPFILGQALSMPAIHGGKAKHDQSDAPKIAALLRGGRLPQAYGDPAEMRATRALLRRRMPLRRNRAVLLAHVPNTKGQSNLPEKRPSFVLPGRRAVDQRAAARIPGSPLPHCWPCRAHRAQPLALRVPSATKAGDARLHTLRQSLGRAHQMGPATLPAPLPGLRDEIPITHEATRPVRPEVCQRSLRAIALRVCPGVEGGGTPPDAHARESGANLHLV